MTVTDLKNGTLDTAVEGADPAKLDFENHYEAEGEQPLAGVKTIDNRDLTGNDIFEFTIHEIVPKTAAEGEEVEEGATEEVLVKKVTNDATGKIDYPTLEYKLNDTVNDLGEHRYVVREVVKNGNGITTASTEYEFTVTVTDLKNGTLDTAVEGVNPAKLDFVNHYEAEGEIQFYARKILVGRGRDLQAGDFMFNLYRVGENEDGSEKLEEIFTNVGNDEKGLITFEPIQYTEQEMLDAAYDLDEAGEKVSRTKQIVYRIIEVPGEDSTVIYDQNSWDITVTLVDDLAGKITATANPDATNPDPDTITVTFTNIVTKILKVDAENNVLALPGAVIRVYDDSVEPAELVFTIKTTNEPVEIENLAINKTYRLHEESAPHGYLEWAFDVYFRVDAEGNIAVGDIINSDGLPESSEDAIIWVDEDGIIRVKDTMKKLTVAIHKEWDDDENRDGLRPTATGITVNLLRDGAQYRSVLLDPSNNWTAVVTGLDAVHVEKGRIVEYAYTWSEPAVTGYDLDADRSEFREVTLANTEDGESIITTLTNKHTSETVKISVRKEWVDDGSNRKPITVQLYADEQVADTVTLDDSNGWKWSWTDLPRNTNPDGQMATQTEIKYTVAETGIPDGYIAMINNESETSFVITNTKETGNLVLEKKFEIEPWELFVPDDSPLDIPVIKTWNDDDNKDGNRPESVTVHLLADGVEIASAVLSEANGWRTVFTGLPRLNENKERINYTMTEDPVQWYEAEINGYNIRNNYKPELTSVSVKKVWDDNNNAQKLRPTSIVMTLENNVTDQKWTVELNAQNNWKATIDNLPTVINGKPVTYTWTEQEVVGYTQTDVQQSGNTTIFTNTVKKPKKDDNQGGKKPKGAGDTTKIDDYDTPLGVEIMINHVGDCFD